MDIKAAAQRVQGGVSMQSDGTAPAIFEESERENRGVFSILVPRNVVSWIDDWKVMPRQQVMVHSSSSELHVEIERSCVRKQQSQDTDSSSQKVL